MRPMRSLYRRSRHNVPTLNMASMPDLIFTVLFFFMIVTHMRSDELKVRLEVPQGTEVQKPEQQGRCGEHLYRSAHRPGGAARELGRAG